MKPIRVLVLITQMDRAGAETIAMNYMRYMDRNIIKYDFLVNRMGQGDYEREIEELGGHVYHMCPLYPNKLRVYKREFRNFLKEHPDYDIVHSHLEERSFYALKIAKEMGIPFRICHGHSHPTYFNTKWLARYYLKYRVRKYCTHFFACSREVAKWLYGGKHSDQAVIMKNAIDTQLFTYKEETALSVRKELKLGDALVIGHVGRFQKVKNHKKLLNIFAEVKRRQPDAKLVLVGGGENPKEIANKEKLMQRVREMQLQNSVIFTGVRQDIHRVMQAFDIFVMPSYSEGFPVTLVEAQSLGIRCVVSDEISPKCDLIGNMEFLPLALKNSMWANRILKIYREPKENLGSKVKEKGFDIRDNAYKLQKFYEGLMQEKNT